MGSASIAGTDGAHSTWTRVVGLAALWVTCVGSKADKVDLEMGFKFFPLLEVES